MFSLQIVNEVCEVELRLVAEQHQSVELALISSRVTYR